MRTLALSKQHSADERRGAVFIVSYKHGGRLYERYYQHAEKAHGVARRGSRKHAATYSVNRILVDARFLGRWVGGVLAVCLSRATAQN